MGAEVACGCGCSDAVVSEAGEGSSGTGTAGVDWDVAALEVFLVFFAPERAFSLGAAAGVACVSADAAGTVDCSASTGVASLGVAIKFSTRAVLLLRFDAIF